MTQPKVVLLTGEIGSGKSTVRKLLEAKGVPCIDADAAAATIQCLRGHDCLMELELVFPGCLTADGVLNRPWMREQIANDPLKNKWLVEIMTPHVMAILQEWTNTHAGQAYVVWESAIMRYAHDAPYYTLTVLANNEDQLARIKARNPDWTNDQIVGIIKQQQTWMYRSNGILPNIGTLADLQWEVDQVHEGFLKEWENKTWE